MKTLLGKDLRGVFWSSIFLKSQLAGYFNKVWITYANYSAQLFPKQQSILCKLAFCVIFAYVRMSLLLFYINILVVHNKQRQNCSILPAKIVTVQKSCFQKVSGRNFLPVIGFCPADSELDVNLAQQHCAIFLISQAKLAELRKQVLQHFRCESRSQSSNHQSRQHTKCVKSQYAVCRESKN